jgi:hypothetical protein
MYNHQQAFAVKEILRHSQSHTKYTVIHKKVVWEDKYYNWTVAEIQRIQLHYQITDPVMLNR